ncbi:hypothetical protein DFH09DRAFT_1069892 [Mycena vulgaris]|nr:hypothetical protein DFH09DRAFT_1069892 [Mycena vulgaris]
MFESWPFSTDSVWGMLESYPNVLATSKLGVGFSLPGLCGGLFLEGDGSRKKYRTAIFGTVCNVIHDYSQSGISLRLGPPVGDVNGEALFKEQIQALNSCVEQAKQREAEIVHSLNNFVWTDGDYIIVELKGGARECNCENIGSGLMAISEYLAWHNLLRGDIVLIECGLYYRKMLLGPEHVREFRVIGYNMKVFVQVGTRSQDSGL